MSKVIRDGAGFVPKKIIPADDVRPPVWEELARQVEPESEARHDEMGDQAPPGGDSDTDHIDSKNSETSADAHHDDSLSFDDDFSSPSEPDAPSVAEEAPAVPVDIEAIAQEHYDKGVQAGMERMEADYATSIKTLQSICEELNTIREVILHNSLGEMKDLVLQIAEKILRHSLSSQNETIVKTVEEALQQAVKSDEFIISVNPKDYEAIEARSADFINSVNGLDNLVIKASPSVDQGGCLIESSNCTVDATLASQLEVIREAVKND